MSSPIVYFNVYSFIYSGSAIDCPAVGLDTTGCHKEDVRWICYSVRGRVWAPWAVCLRTHLSTPNQILHTAPSFYIQFDNKGYRTRWKVWGFLTPHAYSRTGPAHSPPPHHLLSHLNLKPFISFLFSFIDNAILKALCLVIPLCEHVNNLLQKC